MSYDMLSHDLAYTEIAIPTQISHIFCLIDYSFSFKFTIKCLIMFRVWTKKLGRVGISESHVYFLALTCRDAEQLGKPFLLKGNFIFLSNVLYLFIGGLVPNIESGSRQWPLLSTVKPDIKTTSIKWPPVLRDHFQILPRDITIILTCIKRPPLFKDQRPLFCLKILLLRDHCFPQICILCQNLF